MQILKNTEKPVKHKLARYGDYLKTHKSVNIIQVPDFDRQNYYIKIILLYYIIIIY